LGSAAGDADRAVWRRRFEDAVGEDPVRFLDVDLVVTVRPPGVDR